MKKYTIRELDAAVMPMQKWSQVEYLESMPAHIKHAAMQILEDKFGSPAALGWNKDTGWYVMASGPVLILVERNLELVQK